METVRPQLAARAWRTANGYLGAVAATGVATVARLLLDSVLGDHTPYALFFAAVAFAAWVGGLRPALLATGLGFALAWYFVVPPRYSFGGASGPHLVGLAMYVLASLAIAGFGEAMWAARRRAEEQGERLRTTLASIGDAVIATDADGRVTNMNAVAEALTAWTTAEAKGQPLDAVFRIVNEETRKAVGSPVERALREGVVVGLANHTILIARDGTERPIDDSAAPIRCASGEVVGCVLVFRDITVRRAAEARVVAERDRAQMVADAVPALISYIDADARYRLNNRAYETWFEHPRGELVGRHARDVLGEAAWAAIRPHVEAALAGRVASYEAEVPYRDGGTRWVMATYTPDVGDGGAVRGLIAHVADVTALKRAERQVVTTLESITDGFVRYDRDWRVVYVNAEGERIHQLTRAEMLGKIVWELFPAVLGTKLENQFRRAVADQVTVEFENYYEPWDRWYALKGYPTPDGGLTTFIRDITAQKKADALLAGQKRVLEMVAADAPLADVLAALCVVIEEQSPGVLTAILLLGDDRRVRATAGPNLPDGYLSALDALGIDPPYHGPCGAALATGEEVVGVDAEADERWSAPWRELVRGHGLRACRTTPILAADGTILGTFVVCSRQPGDPAPPDPNVIGVATHLAGLAVERQRHEAELRASEAKFRELADVMPQIVYVNAADGRLEFVNRRWAEFTGQTQAETADLPPVVHPDDLAGLSERWGRATAEGTPLEAEFRLRHAADGEYRWFLTRSVPIRDGAGRVMKWYGTSTDIHDQKQAEREVRRSEARLRRVFESNVVGMIRWDLDRSLILDANTEFLRLTGYTRDDIATGRLNFRDLTPPEWSSRNEEGIRTIRAQGFAAPYEKEYFRKDGSRVPLIIAGTRFEDSPSEGMSLLIDISDRKQAEREIVRLAAASDRQRRLYETVLSNTPDLAYVFDLGHRFTYANHALLTMWGRTWADAIGKNCLELGYEPWHAEMHDREIEQVVATRQPVRGEVAFDGTGGRRIYDYSLVPVIGRNGEVEAVAGTARDVTDRKRVEEAHRLSEERLRLVVESATGFAIFTMDGAGVVTGWNSGAERLFGYPDGEIVGKSDRVLYTPADAAEGVPEREIRKAAAEGRAVNERWHVRKDGSRFWGSGLIQPLRTDRGTIVGFLKIMRDMTEARQWQETLERQAEELKAADRRKDEFLATLAHELRNPLAPIRSGLQVIRLAGESGKVEHARAMMERQLSQLVRLVDDLLDVSRITRGKLELRRERVELGAVVDAAVESARPLLEQAEHELTIDVPDAPVFVDGDAARLAQVVSNLLTNAAKYTPRGGHVRLGLGDDGGTAVVAVVDNGIGIPPAMLDRVFEMFTQVDRTLEKTTGGLGIGLSLVRGLVEMHGGTVEARSEGEGKGSAFVVRLPVATPGAGGADRPDKKDEEVVPSGRRRILVVDDNADAADSLGQLLEMLGNDVRTAYDGQAGVEAAEAFRPAVVLCDIGMPKLNGYAAARRIRGEPWGRDMVLVALTGWGQEDDRQKSADAGFDYHLVKPVEAAALTKLLAGLGAR